MSKTIISFILLMALSIPTIADAHRDEGVFGEIASDRDIKTFHSRSKNINHHLDLSDNQIDKINSLLGRKMSYSAINFKKVYSRLHSNRKGGLLGKVYKIEKDINPGKIVILLEIHHERIAKIRVSSTGFPDAKPNISKKLFASFQNQPLKQFSNNMARLIKKEDIETEVASHPLQDAKVNYMDNVEQLKKLEEDYSILSLIQECITLDEFTSL